MSNREKAAEIIYNYGETTFEKSLFTARALSAEGVLAPDPIPLNEDDRNFVIDTLKEAVQQADYYGLQPIREAWEAAANAFAAHTTIAPAQKGERSD